MSSTFMSLLLMLLVLGECHGQTVTQTPDVLTVTEGNSLFVSCTYKTSVVPYLFWYVQYPNGAPRLLLSELGEKDKDGFSAKHQKNDSSFHLRKSSLEAQDAAWYFCALRTGARKLTFGSGTKLIVKPNIRNSEPSVYVLQPPKGKASEVNPLCLVTDFSPANETKVVVNEIPQNNSPTLVKTDGQWSYGIVAWSSADECKAKYFNEFYSSEKPKDGAQDVCSTGMISEHFETDEKLNSLSLTVLGLRIIFAKTVVINVLMTLRLWRS